MKTKLTLTVDAEIIARTKRLAKKRRTSVSGLFEEWSSTATQDSNRPPLAETLLGQWPASTKDDPRLEYLLQKHAD
ncbi:MAG: hypothetical protein EA353_01325 [Puniceicoccaceae bacterium]|nr:MAG: hypothetical protein EA353_01325 [Puniceicoccaceae bacterium]